MPLQPDVIDLRSDANTVPTAAMREAMMRAPVGDDQYGEDPSVNALEAKVAGLLGKEAAMFVASGTMANQVALHVLARRGDEVVAGGEAHVLWHETGAAAALAGVQIAPIGATGLFDAQAFRAAVKPRGHFVFPPTGLVVVENTHNRGGGLVFPQDDAIAICAAADELGIPTLLDGARLFNAACVTGLSAEELARPFRMAWIALSKGLGCPVGSVIAGTGADIAAARRVRRMMGGAMRQAGFLAAAGLYALDHNVSRIAEDHATARALAEVLASSSAFQIDPAVMQTNIVIARMAEDAPDARTMVERARAAGVLILPFGPRMIRAVTYLGVGHQDCVRAGELLVEAGRR
jgi:threonine aldolase